ncbi:hypothetical protein VNI00_016337 [Paramarasmius palmivorus]|uniref:Bacteriophage T5 Orf172 DNA-binding domain-containing protein n=1 Tax=Paramarasmius palmivorus TaxID=297713 RepID=A0AAW0BDN6_9AGAR
MHGGTFNNVQGTQYNTYHDNTPQILQKLADQAAMNACHDAEAPWTGESEMKIDRSESAGGAAGSTGFVYAFRVDDHPNQIQRVKIGCTIDLLSARRQTNAHLARFAVTPLSANLVRYNYKTESLVNLLSNQHIVVGQCIEPSCNTSHTEYFVLANDLQHQIHDVVAALDAFLTVYQPA